MVIMAHELYQAMLELPDKKKSIWLDHIFAEHLKHASNKLASISFHLFYWLHDPWLVARPSVICSVSADH